MLSQSHDKKVVAMLELFEQVGLIDLHFATLEHGLDGLDSEATPNACVIHVMYAEEQQAQRHRPPWPGDYIEAVPGNSPGEGPGAV